MDTVRNVLAKKGTEVWSIAHDRTVYEAVQMMAEKDIGALLVIEADKPAGIFSERDYARQVILKGKSSRDTPVREVMTTRVVCVRPEQTVEECMALMTDKHVRHLPVITEGKIAGLLSIGDVVKAVISEKQFLIKQLENYITTG
jgi:CBS domain-containing protein